MLTTPLHTMQRVASLAAAGLRQPHTLHLSCMLLVTTSTFPDATGIQPEASSGHAMSPPPAQTKRRPGEGRIMLPTIQELVFRAGALAEQPSYIQAAPRLQLQCDDDSCGDDHAMKHVTCTNVLRGRGVKWQCLETLERGAAAKLESNDESPSAALKLGKYRVDCEGFSHRGDIHVFVHSCVLFYTLAKPDLSTPCLLTCAGILCTVLYIDTCTVLYVQLN